MPELPELQALAERLDDLLAGAAFAALDALQFSAIKTVQPPAATLAGRELGEVKRRGKYLVFDFDGPRVLVHLSEGGRVEVEDPPKRTRPKRGVARLVFEGRASVLVTEFGTHRKAGCWIVAEHDDGPLERLGPEPFSQAFRELILGGSDPRRIHSLLRDQRTVAGIGRGYADEILHRARISPYASLDRLSPQERRTLGRGGGGGAERGIEGRAPPEGWASGKACRPLCRSRPPRASVPSLRRRSAAGFLRGLRDHLLPGLPDGRPRSGRSPNVPSRSLNASG